MAVLAVLAAFGGSAYAGAKAAKNSVVSKSVKNNTLKSQDIKNASIKGADVGDNAITGDDVDESTLALPPGDGAVGAAGGDLTGTYPNPTIANGAVDSAEIATSAVGAVEIAADAVAGSELANNAVAGANVVDNSLSGADITEGSVLTGDVGNGTLTGTDVNDASLTGADLGNESVAGADILNGSIDSAEVDEASLPFGRAGRDSTVGTFTTDNDIATKTINVPAGGGIAFVVASAQLTSEPGDVGGALIECKLDINENDIPVTQRSISIDGENSGQCATNWAQSVGPGDQTFNLEVTSLDENETASNPVLQVMFVPFNENGN